VQSSRDRVGFASCGGRSPGAVSEALIYHAKTHAGVTWMLTIYAKNEEQTIPAHVLRNIKEELDG